MENKKLKAFDLFHKITAIYILFFYLFTELWGNNNTWDSLFM